ncbi:pumilio domain containing protein [Grosmannia clavigera kw1407]|uniref:Pumilio domain containing protein n=1 Tax=Grosmannia clavigera (strain kw1407 / UAMH 11150) TaxID=655863 RepID=F0XC93_GROCL|nr:pumilio domain containing protein [Grosmannia clavigera kw1407]EFX03506.1 pumilio domain containing protein [Grosmannia clavigera kw1407]
MSAVKGGEKRKSWSAEKAVPKNGAQKKRRLDSNYSKPPSESKTPQNDDKKQHQNGSGSGDNANESNGLSSKESHAKQKQLALERRAAKPLADELARAKKLWERLRRKSHVPKEERRALVDELFGITTGRVRDFVLKHDAVRAVQTAVKYSTHEQRKVIAEELRGTYAQLAESKYAKFLIGKLLVQNDEGVRDMIISEFYGKVRRLINHAEASWILDDVYRGIASKRQKALLLREWYGAEFALANAAPTGDITAELSEILANDPSKRGVILKNLQFMINTLVQKNLTGFTMLHDAMLQYFVNVPAGSEDHKEFMEMVKGDESGDLLKNMAFTKSGARLVCLLLAHGSAKDRKLLLRTYKDTFQLLCGDTHGHTIILAAYDLIDDTVLTSKAIVPEILGKNEEKGVENIIFCANDLNARTTILYLFEGASKALFPASHAADLAILDEIHAIRATTSKKDPEIRRRELVAAMSPQLLAAIAASPRDLVASSFGCQLVTDVLLFAVGDKAPALAAIAQTAAGPTSGEEAEGGEFAPSGALHVSQSLFGTRMLKTLVAGGRFDRETGQVKPVDPPLGFANILYPQIQEHAIEWATGSASSFVVVALLEATDLDKAHATELRKLLSKKENRKALEKAATEETAEQKAKREAVASAAAAEAAAKTETDDKTDKKDKKDKKGKKGKQAAAAAASDRPVGNAGARLLLEKLA